MKRTIISSIALGVFLLADGVSAEPATPVQDEAASTSPDSSSPDHAQYGHYWCYDDYWGWYRC